MNKLSNITKGALLLVGSTILYGIMPILIRTLDIKDVPPTSQVFLRVIFAFFATLIYFLATKSKIEINKKDITLLVAISVFGYALSIIFFTYGMLLTTVGNALFIFYSYAIITPILAFLLLKEESNKYNILALILAFAALFFLFQPNSLSTWKLGGLFAFLSALCQSFYLIGRKKLNEYNSQLLLLLATAAAVLTTGIISFIMEPQFYFGGSGIMRLTLITWLVIALFGLVNFLAWLLMLKGFALIKASTGSLVMLSENIFAILFAFFFFREIPTIFTTIGGLFILASSIIVIRKGKS